VKRVGGRKKRTLQEREQDRQEERQLASPRSRCIKYTIQHKTAPHKYTIQHKTAPHNTTTQYTTPHYKTLTDDEFDDSVPTLIASAMAACAVSAEGFSNIRCTVNSSESRESEYSGFISTFCRFNSTTSHGKKAVGKCEKVGGSRRYGRGCEEMG
jgi:hypothetical protein